MNVSSKKRRHGYSVRPHMNIVAVRPPGMNRAARISVVPCSSRFRSTHFRLRSPRSPRNNHPDTRVPNTRPSPYVKLSPAHAPSAAATRTNSILRSPEAASTPPVMTAVSLGTSGKNASRKAIPKMIAYVQGESEIALVSELNIGRGYVSALGRGCTHKREHQPNGPQGVGPGGGVVLRTCPEHAWKSERSSGKCA